MQGRPKWLQGEGRVKPPVEVLPAPEFPPMEDFPLEQTRDDTLPGGIHPGDKNQWSAGTP